MIAIPGKVVQLINDDGPESPLLDPFILQLSSCSWVKELRVVIPSTDRSWIGSALSRKGSVAVTNRVIGDCQAYLVDGTPGDCANLGIFSLFPSAPDLVISGPNLGQNTGGPFTIASGTLGGAIIAFLSGVEAIAVSSELTPEIWQEKLGEKLPTKDRTKEWSQIALTSIDLIERTLRTELNCLGGVVNINLPWGASSDTEVVLTKVQAGDLPRFFAVGTDGLFHHSFSFPNFKSDPTQQMDHDCIVQKKISISMLKPMHAALEISRESELEFLGKLNEQI